MDTNDENIEDAPESPESLFIIEGLTDSGEETPAPQIFDVMMPELVIEEPEEEIQNAVEFAPLSINLAEAEALTPAEQAAELVAGDGSIAEEISDPELAQEEATEESEELVGLPPLYKWGSVAAAVLVLGLGSAIYWKKSHRPTPVIAAAPKRIVPKAAPVEAPAPEIAKVEVAAVPAAPVGESQDIAVAPPPPSETEEPTTVVEPPAPEEPVVVAQVETLPAPTPVVEVVPAIVDPVVATSEPRIRRGEGILQLKNGNLFPGRVMKVTDRDVTLRVAEGDYVFPIDDVVQVLPSGSKDYEGFPNGFVELANGNRIWGKILDKGDETVTIASGIAKIVLKRAEVVGIKLGLGVGIVPK